MKKRLQQIAVHSMVAMTLSTYAGPLIVNAENADELPSESMHSDIVEEKYPEDQLQDESQEPDAEETPDETDESIWEEETIQEIDSSAEIPDEDPVEANEDIVEETELVEEEYDTILETQEVDYDAQVISEEFVIYSHPGNTKEAEELFVSEDYLSEVVHVDTEAQTEAGQWAHFSFNETEIGWISTEALEEVEEVEEAEEQSVMSTFRMEKLFPTLTYSTFVDRAGWQEEVAAGTLSGTIGQSSPIYGVRRTRY